MSQTVSSESWSSPSVDLRSQVHVGPELGGPPVASPDGHWWWTGARWVPVHHLTVEAG